MLSDGRRCVRERLALLRLAVQTTQPRSAVAEDIDILLMVAPRTWRLTEPGQIRWCLLGLELLQGVKMLTS